MNWKALTILLIAAALPMGSATAQSSDDNWARCRADDLDLRISGCTALIESGRETPQDLALAFLNRGNAYDDKGQLDRALQDYDRAIKFDPKNAKAFYHRGIAYEQKRQYARARSRLCPERNMELSYTGFVIGLLG